MRKNIDYAYHRTASVSQTEYIYRECPHHLSHRSSTTQYILPTPTSNYISVYVFAYWSNGTYYKRSIYYSKKLDYKNLYFLIL